MRPWSAWKDITRPRVNTLQLPGCHRLVREGGQLGLRQAKFPGGGEYIAESRPAMSPAKIAPPLGDHDSGE
jgi:hypothetical protein